ncbi:MAG: hypothetical protein ACRD16_12640 [Thermoanaerobaculia bacterium]
MKIAKPGALRFALFAACALATLAASGPKPAGPGDPLALEIDRCSALLKSGDSGGSAPLIAEAGRALREGRRLLALQRLASARSYLAALRYVSSVPASKQKEMRGLESEWTRMGGVLRDALGAPDPRALSGVSNAAARAFGEAALSQVRVYYDSSLEYGRSTLPEQGFFYLGLAEAQREFVAFCRTLPSSREKAPPVRGLEPELDSLEAALLEAYRPPASIDRHGEFIGASSILKEARELDAAGYRYGALLRYLQAALRVSLLRQPAPATAREGLAERLGELDRRLSASGDDESLGRLFLESAQAELAEASPGAATPAAAAIAGDVLPRYFAALEPAAPVSPKPGPLATVTLVRWPYT